jgi:hypothetical protein
VTGLTAAWIIYGEPVMTGETCPGCGFDSVLMVPVWMLTRTGVSRAEGRSCGRCLDAR